jgi:hypothetical protein
VAVQPDEEVLPGQLCCGHADERLRAGEPAVAGLDRPDAASIRSMTSSRSTSSVTAASPENPADPDPENKCPDWVNDSLL